MSAKNSIRKKVQPKKKFNWKWPGNLPSKIKDALSGVSFIRRAGRIASGGGCIDLRKISLVVLARWLHRVQIAFMSMVKRGCLPQHDGRLAVATGGEGG